jgi:hypothetical protein
MLITKLEDLVGKEVELLVSGHFFIGRITSADPASDTIEFVEDGNSYAYTIDTGAVALVKVQ